MIHRLRCLGVVLSFLLAATGDRILAQGNSVPLSPSEAYKAAMAPFNAAKAEPDDLTDADKLALEIGIAHASRDCATLFTSSASFATDAKELLSLSELCIFGQRYQPARTTLVRYLALPQPPERKLALVLLVRALLGLNEPNSAEPQVRSLLRDYPYDAQIHFAIDQVIDALEGGSASFDQLALQLCDAQGAATLPLLVSGKGLEGKDINAPPSVLFSDAVRCAALTAALGKTSAQDALRQLTAIAQQPSWAGTADLASIQAALARQGLVGRRTPLAALHGRALRGSALAPRTVSLTRGTVLLLPFALWVPSSRDAVRDLARFAPQQTIYAITSWGVNTGRDDVPSGQILMALRSWRQALPPHVSMFIVPDEELRSLNADSFPSGIVIRDGVVLSNSVLSSQGAERMLLRTLENHADREALGLWQ